MRRAWLFLLLAGCATSSLAAQTQFFENSRFEVRGKERLVHSGEIQAAPRWTSVNTSLPADSITRGPRGTTVFTGASNNRYRNDIRVWRSLSDAVDSVTSTITEGAQPPSNYPAMEADLRRMGYAHALSAIGDVFSTITLYTGGPAQGTSKFPFRLRFQADTFMRQVEGTMLSRHVRDSVFDGRTLRVLRDSAWFTHTSSTSVHERTLFGARVDTQRLTGTIVGMRVYDVTRQIFVALADTTRMAGTETRRLPSARVLADNITYERFRTAQLLDSVARRQLNEQTYRDFGFGMVRRPPLNAPPVPDVRNARVVDSLVERYRTTRDAGTRDSIIAVRNFRYLPGNLERIARIHLDEADTVGALRVTALGIESPLTEWTYNLVRPVLDDPALAMRRGISTDGLYEAFEYAFRHYPFDSPYGGASENEMQWCPVAICTLVSEEWTKARDPRLKNIGLMALYRLHPARYADSLILRAASGETQLAALAIQAQGMNRATPSNPGIPLPSAGAPWRDWFMWMRGATDETLAENAATAGYTLVPNSPATDPIQQLILNANPNALRMAQLRLGVVFADTFRLKFQQVSGDTAHYTYFTLLQTLGASPPPMGNLVARLRSSSAFDRSMALSEAQQLPYVPADSQAAHEIEETLLNVWLDSAPLWPHVDSTRKFDVPIHKLPSTMPTHIVADSLQPATLTRLRAAGIAVHNSDWHLPNDETGNVVQLGRITQSGDFAIVPYTNTWLVRLPDGRGGGDATGGQCLLVRVNGRWFLVDASFWVT